MWNTERVSIDRSVGAVKVDCISSQNLYPPLFSCTPQNAPPPRGQHLLRTEFDDQDSCGLAISSCGGVAMYGGKECVHIVDITHLS